MEERVPPPPDGNNDPPPPHSLPPLEPPSPLPLPPGIYLPPSSNNLITPLPPPPGSKTYVVQIPKDQVYRVPPAENSKIVATYLQQNQVKKGPNPCSWIFLAIAIFGIALGIFFGVIHAIYSPKLPEFSIINFTVKPSPTHSKSHAKAGYVISLNVENPNERMDVDYGGNGYGLLMFNHHKVADGKFTWLSQEAKKSKKIDLTLKGANVALPSEMQKSMSSTKSKKAVSLGFKIFASAKISSWAKTAKQEIIVSCDFKVNTLAKGTRVVHQECSTQVQE